MRIIYKETDESVTMLEASELKVKKHGISTYTYTYIDETGCSKTLVNHLVADKVPDEYEDIVSVTNLFIETKEGGMVMPYIGDETYKSFMISLLKDINPFLKEGFDNIGM